MVDLRTLPGLVEDLRRLRAVTLRAERDARAGSGAERAHRKHGFARHHQLDRPPEALGGRGDQHGEREDGRLAAETAADIGALDMHVLGRDAEDRGEAHARAHDPLARNVDEQRLVLPGRRGGVELDGIVVLGRRRVDLVDLDGR